MNSAMTPDPAVTEVPRGSVFGGVQDRLSRVLEHDSSPLESNYETMCEGIVAVDLVSRVCRRCRGSGFRLLTKRERQKYEDRLADIADQLARTESDEHAVKLKRAAENAREKLAESSVCDKCSGIGRLEMPQGHVSVDWWVTTRCRRCGGSGDIDSEETEDLCDRCAAEDERSESQPWAGPGFTVPFTARPSPGSGGGGSWSGRSATDAPYEAMPAVVVRARDDIEVEVEAVQYGRVLRWVEELREHEPGLAAAVEAFCGDDGAKWAGHPWGRVFALWPLTSAGTALIRDVRGHQWLLRPCDRIASERIAESKSPDSTGRRRALMRQADSQARALRAEVEAWIASVPL